jgi:hypothetical protein
MEELKMIIGKPIFDTHHFPEFLGSSFSSTDGGVSGIQEISEEQRKINKMMGISDEVFLQHCKASPSDGVPETDVQKTINKMCGISDETFEKYGPKE